jgi:antitoxin (DNA-binding transcriptional repressor) of toxin-antitoxin stability system
VIARAGKPVARLVPVPEPKRPRELGRDRGKIWIADDFDVLPDDILADFEGRD